MDHESAVSERIERWHALREEGQSVTLEDLGADCPELVEPLRGRLRAIASMEAFLGVGDGLGDGGAASPPRAGQSAP